MDIYRTQTEAEKSKKDSGLKEERTGRKDAVKHKYRKIMGEKQNEWKKKKKGSYTKRTW